MKCRRRRRRRDSRNKPALFFFTLFSSYFMSNYPKRPKTDQNDAFKRPHSSVEDLKASSQSLSNILEILDTNIRRLDQETAEFSRQTQLSLFDRVSLYRPIVAVVLTFFLFLSRMNSSLKTTLQ